MQLTLTTYLDTDAARLADDLPRVLPQAAATAGVRVGHDARSTSVETVSEGLRLSTDIDELDGATVAWSGDERLAEVRVSVPWEIEGRNRRTLVANSFASALRQELRAA